MTTQKKNSRLSARAILCQMFCLLMVFTVALPSVAATGDAKNGYAYVVILELLTAVATAIAAVYAACAARRSNDAADRSAKIAADALAHKKSLVSLELVKSVKDKIAADSEMQNMFENIKASEVEIRAGTNKAKLETLNGLLSHFAVIANAWKYKLVNDDGVYLVVEKLLQVMGNEAVQSQLKPPLAGMDTNPINLHESSHKALMELVDHFSPEQKKHGTGT